MTSNTSPIYQQPGSQINAITLNYFMNSAKHS